MEQLARHFMTSDPACCRPHTMLDQVAKMMVQYDWRHSVLDITDRPIGVVTDRDIVCRVVAIEQHQVRRVPVVDDGACCIGIISQADVASVARDGQVGELLREVSRGPEGE